MRRAYSIYFNKFIIFLTYAIKNDSVFADCPVACIRHSVNLHVGHGSFSISKLHGR